ncbi:MAG TPA: alpha/beta fold hydrolase [Thermoanaerobaculia bacterium]|jgi:surfactin synthase thioesterase subunit|nr:alpha/beta fold hydrolase [Thermoanaerobaculia bacterium]
MNERPPTRLPLYCFPYGGAGASAYRDWSRGLPEWIEVRPLQPPGRETRFREAPYTRLAPLVEEMVGKVEAERGPFALFGHSLGGLVAFELARELRRRGRPAPALLVVSGFGAPHLTRDRPRVSHLAADDFWREVQAHYDVTPEIVAEPIFRELAYPVLRADLEIVETYVYRAEPPFDFPLVALGGLGDPEASPEQIAAWKEHSRQPVEVRMFPGGHFYVNSSRPAVLETVMAALGAAISRP